MWSSWAAAQPALALHALQPKKARQSSLSRKPTTQLSVAAADGPSFGGETNKRWERGVGQANYVDPDEVVEAVMTECQYYPESRPAQQMGAQQR